LTPFKEDEGVGYKGVAVVMVAGVKEEEEEEVIGLEGFLNPLGIP